MVNNSVAFLQQQIDETYLQIVQLIDRYEKLLDDLFNAKLLQRNNLNKQDESDTMVIPAQKTA